MLIIKKDSYSAWLVCFGTFLTLAGCTGIDTSFGVVIGTLKSQLNVSVLKLSWIQSIHSFGNFFFAFISSLLLKKYEIRSVVLTGGILCTSSYILSTICVNYSILLLSYGLLGGAGSGLLYGSGNVVCFFYFEKYRSIASGIAISGCGFGILAVPSLCNFMTIEYGYKGYFIVVTFISSLSFLLTIFTCPIQSISENGNEKEDKKIAKEKLNLLRTNKSNSFQSTDDQEISNESKEKNNFVDFKKLKEHFKLLKDSRLFCYCMVHIFYELSYYIPIVFLSEMMIQDHGISQKKAGSILWVLGLLCMIGKLIIGLLLHCLKASPIIVSSISLLLLGVCGIIYPFCSSYEHFIILTAFYGLILSPIEMLIPFVVVEIFGDNGLKDAYGLIMIVKSFSLIWGPPIAGALHDWKGTYDFAFYTSGCFQFVGGLFNILIHVFHRFQE